MWADIFIKVMPWLSGNGGDPVAVSNSANSLSHTLPVIFAAIIIFALTGTVLTDNITLSTLILAALVIFLTVAGLGAIQGALISVWGH